MAIVTTFELFDFLNANESDLSIHATDKNGNTVTLSSTEQSERYILHKYGTRRYSVLTGSIPADASDALTNFVQDFTMWIFNRQKNIDLQYQALFDYPFSPIENYDRYETESIDATDATTYGKKETASGTDSLEHGHKVNTTETLSGTDTNTRSGNETHETDRAGFNSPNSYTNDSRLTDTYNSVRDAMAYGKSTSGSETNSGTDTTAYGKTITDSGTDSTDRDSSRELHAHGNIGVTTATEMIKEVLELYAPALVEMLLDNFIDDYTFYS